jgi:hypothetical protein
MIANLLIALDAGTNHASAMSPPRQSSRGLGLLFIMCIACDRDRVDADSVAIFLTFTIGVAPSPDAYPGRARRVYQVMAGSSPPRAP